VIGRKHADAPYEDGKAIWGDFDAQEIFDSSRASCTSRPCKIGFAAYYESIGRVDLTERHPDEKPVTVSGTAVREQLKAASGPTRASCAPRSPTS
jgi:sulfate adenylyltransferase